MWSILLRMRGRSGWARGAVAALALAAPVGLAACAGTGYQYVKSSENHTYFKVPDNWKLYDEDAVLNALKSTLSSDEIDQARQTSWTTIFDASPQPSLQHVANSGAPYPVGRAIVQTLSPDSADSVSLQSLRNLFFDVDTALNNGTAHVTSYDLVEFGSGFHGSHLVARIDTKQGSVSFNQVAVIDQSSSKVYAISISCSTGCYDKYESKIDNVIDSWTVKDN
jgi:hypothetical protein